VFLEDGSVPVPSHR